ncbi:acyltransferase family protein [Aurantibacter sp.]|uniref:acyltransferase family protein n=1 Tax=Aurantibacter sp. TaxID=2807103 RepID=UPI0035C83DE0
MKESRKLDYIDAIRGIAILMVILVHTFQTGANYYNEFTSLFIGQGARGVQLFFIASAFTLMLSYTYRSKNELYVVKNFLIRRFFRIAPLYYLGIIYFLFQNGFGPRYWLGDASSITVYNIISNFTFTHGFNPYWVTSLVPGGWSITVEMSFYLIFPLLFKLIKNFTEAINYVLITLFVSFALNHYLKSNILITDVNLWNDYLFFYLPNQLPVFGLGIVSFFVIIKKEFNFSKINILGVVVLLIFLCFNLDLIPFHFLISLLLLGFLIIMSKGYLNFLINKVICYIGKVSYSAYLVHFAVLYWLERIDFINYFEINTLEKSLINLFLKFTIVVVITTIVSTFTHKTIELPFQKLGKKLINNAI